MNKQTSKDLQSPVAACIVERKEGLGYNVKKWSMPNANITNQDALEVIAEIEEGFPNVNSSLIRKSIVSKEYLVVGTVWSPPESNDCFLIKWYDQSMLSLGSKSGSSAFLKYLLLLLTFPLAIIGIGAVLCYWGLLDIELNKDTIRIAWKTNPGNIDAMVVPSLEPKQEIGDLAAYKGFFEDATPPVLDAYKLMFDDPSDFKHGVSTTPRRDMHESLKKDKIYNALFEALRQMQGQYDEIIKSQNVNPRKIPLKRKLAR